MSEWFKAVTLIILWWPWQRQILWWEEAGIAPQFLHQHNHISPAPHTLYVLLVASISIIFLLDIVLMLISQSLKYFLFSISISFLHFMFSLVLLGLISPRLLLSSLISGSPVSLYFAPFSSWLSIHIHRSLYFSLVLPPQHSDAWLYVSMKPSDDDAGGRRMGGMEREVEGRSAAAEAVEGSSSEKRFPW